MTQLDDRFIQYLGHGSKPIMHWGINFYFFQISNVQHSTMFMGRSILNMTKVIMSQAGSYTCSPSFARPYTVNITLKHREQALPEPVVNIGVIPSLGDNTIYTLLVLCFFQLPPLV